MGRPPDGLKGRKLLPHLSERPGGLCMVWVSGSFSLSKSPDSASWRRARRSAVVSRNPSRPCRDYKPPRRRSKLNDLPQSRAWSWCRSRCPRRGEVSGWKPGRALVDQDPLHMSPGTLGECWHFQCRMSPPRCPRVEPVVAADVADRAAPLSSSISRYGVGETPQWHQEMVSNPDEAAAPACPGVDEFGKGTGRRRGYLQRPSWSVSPAAAVTCPHR